MRIVFGEIIYIPMIWLIGWVICHPGDRSMRLIALWIFIPLLIFSLCETKRQTDMSLFAPAMFILTATFFQAIRGKQAFRLPRILAHVLLFLLIALPVRYSIERVKPFHEKDRFPLWVTGLKSLNTDTIENGVLFNYDAPIEAMYYTNLIVYHTLPDLETILKLQREGNTTIINDKGNIPPELDRIADVLTIRLEQPSPSH